MSGSFFDRALRIRGEAVFAMFVATLFSLPWVAFCQSGVGFPAPGSGPVIEWKTIVFGQSTTAKDNTFESGPDGSCVLSSLNGKGKVTGAHDGLVFRYFSLDPTAWNFRIEAEVEVITYANDADPAKPKPNNQEAFGLMARDAIGSQGDSSVFASNMVFVGGWRGQIQAVMREGVEEKSGAGARMVAQAIDAGFPGKGKKFFFSLAKTNTGYQLLSGTDPTKEVVFYRPRLMEVQDKRRIYVGFFAARNASIRVSAIKTSFSDPATDPPGLPEPPRPIVPALSVLSPLETSETSYTLLISSTASGRLTVRSSGKEGGKDLVEPFDMEAGKEYARELNLVRGENLVDLGFQPAPGQLLSSEAPVARQIKIQSRSYGENGGRLLVSPEGKAEGDGSAAKPLDLVTAVQYLRPGQTIFLGPGIYRLGSLLVIQRGNDGSAQAPKRIEGMGPGDTVLSFEDAAPGIQLLADHWILSGFSVTKSTSTGIRIGGNDNVVENVEAFANANTGIQISGSSLDPRERWPARNLVRACVSHSNKDPAESDADGFAAKLAVGAGNAFINCVARNNCDDGWDLYTKLETGPIGEVTIERCVAYGNGYVGGVLTKGDGNGFKLGGEGIAVRHSIADSYAFSNKAAGFTVNSNPAARLERLVSADNGGANFVFSLYKGAEDRLLLDVLLSARTKPGPADAFQPSHLSETVYLYDGSASRNISGDEARLDTIGLGNPPEEIL
ncbi:MAG TPA: right-handed parallel beta-helix repeat-containing protein, partial [Rectinemataceae bacterium]